MNDSYEELQRIERMKEEIVRKGLERETIARLEARVQGIEYLLPFDINARDPHLCAHDRHGEEIANAHKRMDFLEESLQELRAEILRVRVGLLRLASDESVHDLIE